MERTAAMNNNLQTRNNNQQRKEWATSNNQQRKREKKERIKQRERCKRESRNKQRERERATSNEMREQSARKEMREQKAKRRETETLSEWASEWVGNKEREREREGETWSDNDDGVTMMIMMITTAMRFVCPRRDARDVRGEQHRAPFPKGLFPTSRQTRTWCTRTHVLGAHTTISTLSDFFHYENQLYYVSCSTYRYRTSAITFRQSSKGEPRIRTEVTVRFWSRERADGNLESFFRWVMSHFGDRSDNFLFWSAISCFQCLRYIDLHPRRQSRYHTRTHIGTPECLINIVHVRHTCS